MKIGKDSTFQDLIDLIKTKIPAPSNANPSMDGTASPGSSANYAREGHVHPSDTSKFDISGGTITGSTTIQGNLDAEDIKATDYAEVLEVDYTPNKSNIVQVQVDVQSNTYTTGYRLDTGSGSGTSGNLSNTYSAFRVVVTQNNEVLYNEVHRTENKLYSYDIPKGSVNVKVYCMVGSVIDGQGNLLAAKVDTTDLPTATVGNANELNTASPTTSATSYIKRQTSGNLERLKKIVGASVVANQLAYNGNFNGSVSGWLATRATIAASNNVLTATCSTAGFVTIFTDATYGAFNDVANHKVLVRFKIKPSVTGTFRFSLSDNSINTNTTEFDVSSTSDWTQVSVVTNPTTSGATGLRIGNTLAVGDTIQLKEVNITDLTAMFGSTIADYIYTLEQTEAGSGIAWIESYGFDLSTYHSYDAGSIQSVCVSGKKSVGKNLLNFPNKTITTTSGVTMTMNSDGSVSLSGTATANIAFSLLTTTQKILDIGKSYKLSGCPANGSSNTYNLQLNYYNTSGNPTACYDYGSEGTFTPKYSNVIIQVYINIKSGVNCNGMTFKPMLRYADITDDTFEPYRSVTYPLSLTQLRGLFKLNSNTLYADGDEYTADGVEKEKYLLDNLGGHDWALDTSNNVFYSTSNNSQIKLSARILCVKYVEDTSGMASMGDKTIKVSSSGQIIIKDSTYTDAATLKTALNGVYAVIEKKTQTTSQLTPYSEYQTIYPNGTEEFIDGLTRDFTVPVYNDIETFVSNSKSIIAEDDVFDGYGNWLRKKADLDEIVALLGDDESGNTKASRAYSVNEFFYKDGAVFKVTASIASGATFTVGTNCTQTTIFAVLTALLNA